MSGRVGEPLDDHSEFVRWLDERVQMHVRQSAADMATVQGGDGGRYRVQMDSEDQPRQVGFLHAAGQRFSPGDRVPILYSRSGEPMILPSMTEAQGAGEQVIGNEHVLTDAIDSRALRSGTVTNGHLTGDAVDGRVLKAGSVAGSHVQNSVLDTNHMRDKAITPAKLDRDYASPASVTTAQNKADDAKTSATNAQGDATDARSRADAARNVADGADTKASRATDDIKTANTRLDRNANDIKALQTQISRLGKRQ